GRDIGTVICPSAEVKLFITASAEVRARRRYDELCAAGQDTTYDTVLADVQARDDRDMNRAEAPLRPATDAVTIDTSTLDVAAAIAAARRVIDSQRSAP
ncbi:MAG: (d)CMP kinase, partial [Paracoccaceae bacterium]